MPTPKNATIDGYSNVYNSSCNFCDALCKPPDVTGDIGFFDGGNWILVAIYAGVAVVLSILA
jgi:hypothetical protein